MLKLKYAAKNFGKMLLENTQELEIWSETLLLKINVITGWVLPENDIAARILTDQFRKKLIEDYSNCNPEELEYAFRKYGTVVKDWGKQMNLSLLDEVMIPYLSRRRELSAIEEGAVKPQITLPMSPDQIIAERKDFVNLLYSDFLKGTLQQHFIPAYMCAFLEGEDLIKITKEDKQAILVRARSYYVNAEISRSSVFPIEINYDDKETLIKNIARQIAVKDYFTICQENDLKTIF